MEKTNNTINTQNNADNLEATQEKENIMCVCDDIVVTIPEVEKLLQNEDTKDTALKLLAIMWKTSGESEAIKKPTVQEELTKANDILENRLAKVAKNFLQDSVQNVIYKTHEEQDFRESIETDYVKVSDLWQTLDDNQKEMLSDILHGLGLSTGMLLTEVFKAGIKAYVTQGETLESLDDLNGVDMSEVFYVALPTDRN